MNSKVWIKLFKNHKISKDFVIECQKNEVQSKLIEPCKHLDISQPLWTKKNINEWENYGITKFYKDDFIDDFRYDYMELSFIFDKKNKSSI